MDLGNLADRIRAKIDTGELPHGREGKVWASFGDERPCSACGQRIFPAQLRYELDLDSADVRFHQGC